jgi:hypothetical protein
MSKKILENSKRSNGPSAFQSHNSLGLSKVITGSNQVSMPSLVETQNGSLKDGSRNRPDKLLPQTQNIVETSGSSNLMQG